MKGEYLLEEAGTGCNVSIDLGVVDLRFPKATRRAVEGTMRGVMAAMGRRFAHNLLKHLGE